MIGRSLVSVDHREFRPLRMARENEEAWISIAARAMASRSSLSNYLRKSHHRLPRHFKRRIPDSLRLLVLLCRVGGSMPRDEY
jgi:hypothetical protein